MAGFSSVWGIFQQGGVAWPAILPKSQWQQGLGCPLISQGEQEGVIAREQCVLP